MHNSIQLAPNTKHCRLNGSVILDLKKKLNALHSIAIYSIELPIKHAIDFEFFKKKIRERWKKYSAGNQFCHS